MKIRDFVSKEVVTVDENKKVIDVAKIMGEKRIGSVIVTKEGKPYGIFTERDLLSKAILDNGLDNPVKNYTSTPLITRNWKKDCASHKDSQRTHNRGSRTNVLVFDAKYRQKFLFANTCWPFSRKGAVDYIAERRNAVGDYVGLMDHLLRRLFRV
ncbi:MAG: CBS domain-containing protein [Archaeoglobus sp.]|uniref:CBS domain-containing protein n=1 Tax=Archaeoglobus sp. TaxID=1872626 RepID=UPI001D4A571B|nr:CBS domain-containing protein [Archaeoglobus sp.]MBO8180991.1 CBS domain-containing protein [Archaeoglobus sp.]